jgi:uncharacterized protein YhfF
VTRVLDLGAPRTELRRRLVALVLAGAKTATAGLASEETALPAVGDRLTLLGYDDEPAGTVEVTEARIVAAAEIDDAFAQDEGEGFADVEEWRRAHARFFERPIGPDTPIEAIRFRLVERG